MVRKVRTGIRTAPKVLERELIAKAKALRDRPELLVPSCLKESCPRCPFDAILAKLQKVVPAAEDESRLQYMARRGHPLARAYAATLLMGLQEKADYLAPAKTPFGTFQYAHRGRAPREQLVGVQYYNVPELRLLTVGEYARKHRLHVYSLREGMVTSCREDRPPEAFVQESLARLKQNLTQDEDGVACPHAGTQPTLVVHWRGAGIKIALCGKCQPSGGNLPAFLAERMVLPDLASSFDLSLRLRLGCAGDLCGLGEDRPLVSGAALLYLDGKKGADEILKRETARAIEEATAAGAYILGDHCFEGDPEAFLRAVGVPEGLRPTLDSLLEGREGGIAVSEASLAKLLGALEEEDVERLLASLLNDQELAEALWKAAQAEGRSREQVVQEALDTRKDMDVLSRLPSWDTLPPLASLADRVARAFKTDGKEEAVIRATHGLQAGGKEKVVSLAFLLALEAAKGKGWTFRKEERELAEFLTPMARDLLGSEGAGYRESLQELLTASGSSEVLPT
ncbi:MAG: hypothetical protein LN410_00890 [Candidatus Thermoplasmatota archaeon]|nr:hypothetical protein [Candidatus Thermoplasmatota archaeon]